MDVLEHSADQEGGDNDKLTGQRKSRLKSIKSRLFGKIKNKDDDGGGMKQSQSESDIMFNVEDSEQEHCMLGSRALSHDSIFLAEDRHLDPEPPRVVSHENIHGKIQALQMKLQQQKIHIGPPPLLLPIKRHEDLGGCSEEDGLPPLSKSISNKVSSQPLSPHPTGPPSAPISQFSSSSGVDFSNPPQFTSLLDNSAARHRMSIKPKNQRASAKNKRTVTSAENRPRSESLNNMEHSLTEREKRPFAKETPRIRSYSSKVLHTGERQTASQIKDTSPVAPLRSLQNAKESRQVLAETDHERNFLSTSPQSHGIMKLTTAETPVSTTRQEATKETKCILRSEAQADKLPSPVVSVDRKGKGELSSSKLLGNNQCKLVSTIEPCVDTIQESTIMQDRKTLGDVEIQNKIDTSSKCGVQNENRYSSIHAPVSAISAVNLRPSSLRRNVPFTDEKCESKTLQPVVTVSTAAQEGHSQTKFTKRQRPVSGSFHFTVSSDKIQERPRTSSFTGVVGQAGLKKELSSPSQLPLAFKIQSQVSPQSKKTKDPSFRPESQKESRAPTHPVIPTKFTDLANNSQNQDMEENQDNEMQELGVEATEEEVQEGVEEAEEAGEDVVEGVEDGKEREATNAFGVKLRSTSLSLKFRLDKAQSEINVKPHSSEVSTPFLPLASLSDSTSCVKPEDHHTTMDSKPKDPPLQTNESSTVSCTLKSVLKDKETTSLLRHAEPPQPLSSPSKATNIVPLLSKEGDLPPTESTAVSSQDNAPTSRTSELSWMDMAREKTRSLQQLFTSKLSEFPGLQTTTQPTSLNTTQPQTQTSTSQANAGTTQNITNQQTATQLPLKPAEVTARHLPSAQLSGRSMQLVQTHTRPNQPSAIQTCTIQTTTSQLQDDSTREVLFQSKPQICNSTIKPIQSTVTCTSNIQSTTHTIHTAKQLSSHPQTPQMPPIQQSSPLRTGPLQAPQTFTQSIQCPTPSLPYPYLSSSPKVTSNLVTQQSANTVLKGTPLNEGGEPPKALGKVDRVIPQGKGAGLEDGRPMWASGLGNKTSVVQRWESQSSTATKACEQNDIPESRATTQTAAPLRPISKVLGTDTGIDPRASVSCVPGKTENREDKWQKKSVPPSPSSSPSPSSPLQCVCDSGQPSWMELAKRKSLAWSDKAMDYRQSKGEIKARDIMS